MDNSSTPTHDDFTIDYVYLEEVGGADSSSSPSVPTPVPEPPPTPTSTTPAASCSRATASCGTYYSSDSTLSSHDFNCDELSANSTTVGDTTYSDTDN
jgi:hypothetical protein